VSFIVKQWGIERYKGFLITGTAKPTFATRFDWYSQGIVLRPGRLSSIVEVKRIEGPIFNSKEAAEQHGLELCKEWIDKRGPNVEWPNRQS
jgi:hypothetical protein